MLKKIKLSAEDWVKSRKNKISENSSGKRLTMCKKCFTFYYKNSWHFDKPVFLEQTDEEDVTVRFTQCSACLEQEIALYDIESGLFA